MKNIFKSNKVGKRPKKNEIKLLNDWENEKVIHKRNILEYDWLIENKFITEIEDEYFYLNKPFTEVEKMLYEEKTNDIMCKYGISDIDSELKSLIKKFNTYNEIKDIAQSLIGKIAELRGQPIKEIHEELDILFEE